MILEKQKKSTFSPRPQSFSGLMEMYEANYIRLRLLCGDIRTLPDESVSILSAGGIPVQLKILERSSHTTILLLTYLFDDENKRPDLKVQVYHDSRQADVISRSCRFSQKNIRAWEKGADSILLCRWRLNRFLFKWVNYLHRQGHHFK
ncbi:MAG TPA: DUF1249 domain-containing protein [Leucothrix mucor]|nr:DUF1249 domain-containing protein [Leucothrix mucor]